MRDRRNARERFAAKAERTNGAKILGIRNLARGVPFERQSRISRLHPVAIVLNPNELLASELDRDHDPRRAGIERVLDELLDDGCRALDDFARGDLVGEMDGKPVDTSHVLQTLAAARL
jgi:hypothetical protein